MHATARRPLWVRVGAGLTALILFLTNTVYPWISLLPAPPIAVAQEESQIATSSAEATPAASVATPAPSPLDPLDNLDSLLLPSSPSAEIIQPEETPEATPSATPTPLPEPTPEDPISTPSATPTSLPSPSTTTTPSPSASPFTQTTTSVTELPPLLSSFTISLKYPFAGTYPVSYGFGEVSSSSYVRLMQSLFEVEAHDGIDFAMPEGTPILAADSGTVLFAGPGLYGTTIILQHAWGNSYYGHLSQISVTVGDSVATSQAIGLSGNTGVSTAPHLHFGIRPSHYDPYNGYHGMIDPLPYLSGTVLGSTTSHNYDLIHLPYKTLSSADDTLSIPIVATNSAQFTYRLTNPKGETVMVYPTIYNYGTGDTAILPRPAPFIPGQYTLVVEDVLGHSDRIDFSWGVLTLNADQSRYLPNQPITLAIAVLDSLGEMVCDADLTLTLTRPDQTTRTLTTQNQDIIRNLDICQSKAPTLTPDYEASLTESMVGTYGLTLTAYTHSQTYTYTDQLEVVATAPYTLKRHTPTRIYPANTLPVIFELTSFDAIDSEFLELAPASFVTTPIDAGTINQYLPNNSHSLIAAPYTRQTNAVSHRLTWNLKTAKATTYLFGYTYDAPDTSPAIHTLGPATFASLTEARSWQIAVDGTELIVGNFKTSGNTTWTNAGDADLALVQPDPLNGDLMLAVIAIRPSSSTVNTPSGWTSHGSWTGTDGGAEGVDTGSVRLYWFSKTADGTEGTGNQTFTESGTTSVWLGNIFKVRSATGTYSVSAGGYSLNGDATNWNGTLDTDIGTHSGDLIFIAGAQNGDLSNASGYAIAATNLTTQSTMTEINEFTSQTGNDVEIDIAQNQIWNGNNTTTPTITFTQSVAASGAVSAIRIRQGSGTNRTDTWLRSIGLRAAGTTSAAPSYPDHDYGDLLVLSVVSRGSGDPTPTTPTGWTLIGSSYNGGSGSFAADAGASRVTSYYREATSLLTGTVTVSVSGGSVTVAQIYSLHRDDLSSWTIASDGGTDTTVNNTWSVTGSGLSLDSVSGGDVVLIINSVNTDTYTYTSPSLTASGSTIDTSRLDSFHNTGNGNDMGIWTYSTEVTSGSGSAAPTFSSTSSGSAGSAPTGSAMFIKILGNQESYTDSAVGFFTPPATWTAAADANLSLTYPDPRSGDLMLAITAIRPSSSTVDTPSGWTLVDSRTGSDGGAEGTDTGSVGIYVFSKTSDGTEGTGSLAFTETGTTSVWIGNIMKLRSGTGTYSVSGSGYSLNGDTVTWGATLGSDIGLTSGDVVVLAAAQNGDLSNASAWDIAATGITQKSTINEHGEFTSTTGNDIEVDLASGIIWSGTNSATPTLTLTQSAAASGVVSAIRIREGSGTQRTDTWLRSASAQVVSTSTTLSLVYPEHEVGDMLVMFVSTRGTSDPTLLTPYGWTSLGSYNGGAGSFGIDAGNARVTAFYHEATTRHWGTQAVVLTSADVAIGQILSLHNKDNDTWTLDSDGGTDTSAGTSWSVTGSGLDFSSSDGGDIILVGNSINTDAYTYTSHALAASGITFGETTQTAEYRTTSGSDASLVIATSRVTAGSGSSVAPTYTMTGSGSTANAPAGSALFVKIVGEPVAVPINISGTANGNNGATVKVAVNGSVQPETDTISGGTWEITSVSPPAINDIITVWVDNVGDTNESSAVTKWTSGNITDMVLDTNVLTLGSNQNTSLSLTNLNTYDCTEDEDIMFQAASSHLKVEGDSCAGSTTNSYSAEEIEILASNTLTVTTSETLTTYDITITGTITSTGNSTYNVSHNWNKTGTFTADTSTVNLTGADSSTQTLSGSTSFYNLVVSTSSNSAGRTITHTAGTTQTVTGTWTVTGTSSKTVTLNSTSASSWTIQPTASSVTYAAISYSNNTGTTFCATNSTDSGNNTSWSISSTTICQNTAHSFQRKTWHDGTRFWRSSQDISNGRIIFEYSTDGSSWTENTSARISTNTNDFALHADSSRAFISYRTSSVSNEDNLLTSNLVGYWKLDESTTGTCSGSKDSCDSSGNTNGGTWTSGATYTSSGKFGNALSLDGTDDYVLVTDHNSLDVTSTFTIAAWIYPTSTSGDQYILSKDGVGTDTTNAYGFFVQSGGRICYETNNVGNNVCPTATNITTNTWQHVAVTFNDAASPKAVLYVNGVAQADDGDTTAAPTALTTNLLIGRRGNAGDEFAGNIDDLRLYSTTLSSDDISKLANPGYDVEVRAASSYPGTSFGWGNPTAAYNGTSSTDFYHYPTLTQDSSSKVWLGATRTNGSTYTYNAARATSANDITTWDTSTSLDSSSNSNKYGVVVPRTSGAAHAIWIDGTAIESKNYNGTTWDGSPTSVATGVSGVTTSLSALSDSSGNVHLVYINSSNQTAYQEFTSSWQTAVTLDSNSGNTYPTISLNTSNSDVYAFWVRGDDIYYKKGVSTYTSGNWDTNATSWQTTGSNRYISSNFSGNNSIFVQWDTGGTMDWDQLSLSNTAPNSPSSLLQKTTGDVTLTTGAWHNSTSLKFTATATDTDNPDTLQLCIEIDQLGTSFSNTEDSCGSGVAYSGSGVSVTHTITVTDAQEYHWQARVKDAGGLYSSWVSYDANAESARDVGVDTTAPTGGTVYDGSSVGVDTTFATSSLSSLSANWASFNTNVSGLARYDYSIGTSAGGTDIKAWTDNSTTTSVTATGLTLQTSQLYYVNVRAVDNAGNVQSAVSSNGQLVAPSISFAISPATTTFSNLSAGNSYTDTEVTTLTTSTNAYNGYVIRAFTTDLLKNVGGTHEIANFSAGSYASPATWSGSETGFGYTSSDTSIQGSDKFGSGTLYAPFSQTGPGDIVADHTSTVTGTSISNESFNITYKVKVPSSQAATNYTSTVIYTATAQY